MVKKTPKALLKYLIKLLKFVVILRRLSLPVGKENFLKKKKKKKIAILQKLKLDWQCSQDTHEPDLRNKERCRSRNYNHEREYILQLSLSI